MKAQLWRPRWSGGGAFRFCSFAPQPTTDMTPTHLVLSHHSEPNHSQAYPQWGQSTVAYNCRGGKIAINGRGRRSPKDQFTVSLEEQQKSFSVTQWTVNLTPLNYLLFSWQNIVSPLTYWAELQIRSGVRAVRTATHCSVWCQAVNMHTTDRQLMVYPLNASFPHSSVSVL